MHFPGPRLRTPTPWFLQRGLGPPTPPLARLSWRATRAYPGTHSCSQRVTGREQGHAHVGLWRGRGSSERDPSPRPEDPRQSLSCTGQLHRDHAMQLFRLPCRSWMVMGRSSLILSMASGQSS